MADISSYIRTQLNSFVLEVQGTKSGAGTPIVMNAQQSPASKNQLWTIEADGHIRSQLNGLVLDVQGGISGAGTPVVINAQQSPASKNQLWTIEAGGHIRSQLNGLVLDVQGSMSDPGTPVIVYSENSPASKNQLWTKEIAMIQRSRYENLTNLALNKPATASSTLDEHLGAGSAWHIEYGNNGNNGNSWVPLYRDRLVVPALWGPGLKHYKDEISWWQVDLGNTPYQIWKIELVTFYPYDLALYNFEIWASNDKDMNNYVVLGGVDSGHSLPHAGTFVLTLADSVSYQYIRVAKLVRENYNEIDISIADFRVWGI